MVEERGGRVLWSGRAEQVLIGDPAADWDVVVLVEYPSRAAFVEMVSSPEYLEAHADREAGLERTVVLACSPGRAVSAYRARNTSSVLRRSAQG